MIGFVLVLAGLSISPTIKLQETPPADFVAVRASAAGPKAALAGGYWEVAARVIQWKYSRAAALPLQAPADFTLVEGAAKPGRSEDQTARAAYWAELREEWLRPENWHTTYGMDLSWTVRSARNVSRAIMQFIHQS